MQTVTYQQPKRDTFSICPVCGENFRQDGIGRMRKFCSDACKMKAHRRVIARQPVRKEINQIRTDYLEKEIGYAQARQDYAAEETLRMVAREVSAPIEPEKIAYWRDIYSQEIARWQTL